jgi:hypothetical protein
LPFFEAEAKNRQTAGQIKGGELHGKVASAPIGAQAKQRSERGA